jgi:hypothetical protein
MPAESELATMSAIIPGQSASDLPNKWWIYITGFTLTATAMQGLAAFHAAPDSIRVTLLVCVAGGTFLVASHPLKDGRLRWRLLIDLLVLCLLIVLLTFNATAGWREQVWRGIIGDTSPAPPPRLPTPYKAIFDVMTFSDEDGDGIRGRNENPLPIPFSYDSGASSGVARLSNGTGVIHGAQALTTGHIVISLCGISQSHEAHGPEDPTPLAIEIGIAPEAYQACVNGGR